MAATKPPAQKPKTADDWFQLAFDIQQLFDGAPIDEEDLFAGRSSEVHRIIETVFSKSKHVVLFGEKGVGKTSLSNIFWKRFNKTLKSFIVARVQAGPHDTFSSLWLRALEELQAAGDASGKSDYVQFNANFETITPSQVRRELQKCKVNALPIIIIDEYSEVVDDDAKKLTANLIKEFYDFTITTTVILVGVAENISELIADHASIDRAIIQIPLNRMSDNELKEIIQKRANRTVMTFSGDATWTIIALSRGLPYFTQTLSKFAALHAIDNQRIEVTNEDVEASMARFIEGSEKSFKEAYRDAIRSNQDNNFEHSLLACALAKPDEEGFFTANDVVDPYSAIMKEKKRIAHFEKHLRRFSSDDGGNILIKRGGDRKQTFRFKDPMMQPYVIIRGIQNKLIPESAKAILLQREQGSFSI
ncbi:MAG: AAA family ATPase [Bradyrhizobium sp.]|uniref:ATP-binding protein n=1 Tax=Bradyrhizobium sp. TaxID=376 RepID=UPI001C2954DE|nr:ATP-binding protein [Bradyrhizobium sp.]MBU6463892.1 AAA family ATPase [Pseudomonadota bacterium]MDE2067698.1 AAA family ATPase [Bradyrhizobium sp.]MDE2467238.1 AAA family ATPase [Bradyrhizobium sp.]